MLTFLKDADPSRYVIYVGFLAIFVVFSIVLRDDGFATASNLLNIVQQTAPVTVMAVGMVFVLTAGEIDLSIGSIVAIAALLAAVVLRDWPWPVGVGGRMTNLKSIPIENDAYNALFGAGSLFGVPSLALWTVAAIGIGWFVFRETRFGAHIHATGDNARAARAAGIKVLRLRFGVFLLSGMLAALAGLLYAGRLHGARYTLGEGDLLTVIAAVIVGGTRLNGGSGSMVGALIGSLLMGMLNNGLILMGFEPSDQMIARGLIILIAVALTLREPDR